jgi:hypothetical protein
VSPGNFKHDSGYLSRSQLSMWLAVVLYAVFVLVSFSWSWIAGRPSPLHDPARTTLESLLLGIAIGATGGLAVVAASRLLMQRFPWARELRRWFGEVLGPMPLRQVLLLALLSSVGEEMLFRGAMQPTLGLWITSLIFGLLHIPPRRDLLPWTAMAALLGLFFGWLTLWSGNIAGAVVAHFIINLLNLHHVARHAPRHGIENLPGAGAAPSMEAHEQSHAPPAAEDEPEPTDHADRGSDG